MTEVGPAELSRLLQTRRNECSAIVTSRKRKLRELFAVATQADALPDDGFSNPDAPAATPAEWQFLQASDILQGKTLNEQNIPARPRPSLDKLRRLLGESSSAAISHAPTESPAGLIRKAASSDAANQVLARHVASTKSSSVAPLVAKIPPPTTPVKPAPITKPSHSSTQPPGHPVKATSKPLAAADPPTRNGDHGTPRRRNGETNGYPKGDSTAKRPAQVKFPPGTKGSPSADLTSKPPATPTSTDAAKGMVRGDFDVSAADAHADAGGPLSIRLPTDASRVPDALSTPGSTAPSATTPAVHDASTDTSPDRDGPRYLDSVGRKLSSASNEVKSQASGSDEYDRRSIEGDLLLQESIRSSESAARVNGTTARGPAHAASAESRPTKTVRPAGSECDPKQASASQEARRPQSATTGRPALTEVPDSQGCTPEAMDVDSLKVKPEMEEQSVLSSRDTNLPARDAPPACPTTKLPAREQPSAPERAVTRVSSGAMRLKSVNEIVGGLPRLPTGSSRDSTAKGTHDQLTPVTSTPQSPASRVRNTGTTKRDKFKSHASTVLFGKQPKRVEDRALVPGLKETIQASDDYYTTLFVQNFTGSSKWMQPLERILFQANKTISSPDAHLVIQDHQACRVLRRVYHLQQNDKWSLRQPKRCPEPVRLASHWDSMLQEMRWMRTDFREERKWKMAVARKMAHACAEWYEAGPEERKCLQVEATRPPTARPVERGADTIDMADDGIENQPTPDLVPSGDADSPQNVDDLVEDFAETVAPSAIFALQEDEVVFGLRRTAASDQLLEELPMYGLPLKAHKSDVISPDFDPDAHWRRPALPLSKYVEGEMKLVSNRPPQKRGRYYYENEEDEDEDEDRDGQFVRDQLVHNMRLPPSTDEVSLFHPESKHIRDRLHAGHQFRPPSEHPMPTQSFYESRSPSQWTLAEDDELRGLVREYSYNWSLISSILSTKSSFAAGAERRTPWECFERWINLEGLPADMQKTQYFKAYNSRIEAAQKVIAQQNQLAAQQASAAGAAVTPMRRRPSLPLRVEKRRNQKHFTMLDAMRKLAKKRETAIQKQQHSASQNAANKKTNEAISQRPAKTPRDYSLMRWERDQALAEKMAQYAQRQEAQRRAAMQARVQAQAAQAAGAAAANMPAQNGGHLAANPSMNGAGRPMSSHLAAAASQNRPRMPMQAPQANGVGIGGVQAQMNGGLSAPPQMNGSPQTQVPGAQAQHRMPMPNQQPDASLMLRAQRISEQQRAAVQIQQQQQVQQQHQQQVQQQVPQQQQQQPPPQQPQQLGNPGTPGATTSQHNSPSMRNGVNGISQQSFMSNPQAMMASYAAAATANGNGLGVSQANGVHLPAAANGSSPGQRTHTQLPPGIAAQLNHLETSFRAKNPNLTPEQARQLATEHLTRAMMAQRQNAMNAAAGASGQTSIANSMAATTSPHQYAALLRQQQQAQQAQQAQQQQQAQPHKAQHHQAQQQQHQAQAQQAQQAQQQQHHGQQQQSQPRPAQQLQQQHQHHVQSQQHQQAQQQHHQLLQQQQQRQPPKPQPPQQQPLQQQPQPQYQQHAGTKQGTPVPAPAATPAAASASPAQSHQRTSSGSATPSALGK